MEKDPALLGKRFEVEITSTGKHFLKGSVLKESLVTVLPRPLPLPEGRVSGVAAWKHKLATGYKPSSSPSPSPSPSPSSPTWRGFGVDIILLTFAAAVLSIALLTRFVGVN